MVSTIVVPLDGSELAERALPYARALAKVCRAKVLFVSAIESPHGFAAWTASRSAGKKHLDDATAERQAYLKSISATFSGVRSSITVEHGSASDEIVDEVEDVDNPLVVMTSHGRSGAKRLVVGSVASRVIHDVECPVMIIRVDLPDLPEGAKIKFSKALVPLDGSEFGEHALDQAIAAIEHAVPALHLLRVVEIPALSMVGTDEPSVAMNYGLVEEYLDATRDEAKDYLEKLSKRLTDAGHVVSWEVRDGDVLHAIEAAAEDQQVDLIAMSTHSRRGFRRFVLGSVSEKVLHETKRPLLLIRPPEKD